MKSAEIYKILNSCFKDVFKELGYKKLKCYRHGWYKSIGQNFIIFSVYCNKNGWNYWWGTDFHFCYGCHSQITEQSWPFKPVPLLSELVEDVDLYELVAIQNSVTSKCHRTNPKDFPSEDPQFLEHLDDYFFKPIEFPPSKHEMECLRIYDESDVYKWGEFFRIRIKRISDHLEVLWQESS